MYLDLGNSKSATISFKIALSIKLSALARLTSEWVCE